MTTFPPHPWANTPAPELPSDELGQSAGEGVLVTPSAVTAAQVKVVRVAFTFDTPDLLAGIPIYVPVPQDLLVYYGLSTLDISTAWDGSTPTGHFLQGGVDISNGFSGGAIDMTLASSALGDHAHEPTALATTAPVVFDDDTPVLFSVDDGSAGDPGSTQGAAILRLVIASGA